MRADIESLSPSQREILIRMVALIQVPKETWTQDDHQFFREVRESIQRSAHGRAEQRNGGPAKDSIDPIIE